MMIAMKNPKLAALALTVLVAADAHAAKLTLATGGDVEVPSSFAPFTAEIKTYLEGFAPADYAPRKKWKTVGGVNSEYNLVEFARAARGSRPLMAAAFDRVGTSRAVVAVATVDGAGVIELARNEVLATSAHSMTSLGDVRVNDVVGSALVIETLGLGNGQATVSIAHRNGSLAVTGVSAAGPVGRGREDVLFCKASYDFTSCSGLTGLVFTSSTSQADLDAQVSAFTARGCVPVIEGDPGCVEGGAVLAAGLIADY